MTKKYNFRNLLFIVLFCLGFSSFAAEINFQDGDRLIIQAKTLSVKLDVQPSLGKRMLIKFWSNRSGVLTEVSNALSFEKQGNMIMIRQPDQATRTDWFEKFKNKQTVEQNTVEIQTGESLVLDISIWSGGVHLANWKREAKVHLYEGKLYTNMIAGDLKASLHSGDLNLNDHSGNLDLDLFSGQVHAKNISGDLKLNQFQGNLILDKARGNFTINLYNVVSKLNSLVGNTQIDLGKNKMSVIGYQGRFEGQSGDADLNLQMKNDSEVHLRVNAGRTQVQLPPASGASLNLQTQEGELQVPSELKVQRLGGERVVRGRLSGENAKLSVFIRSAEGSIFVR